MSFTIDDNITVELQKIGNKAKRITNKAVRESAPIFSEELKAQTPYENVSDRSWKAQRKMDKITGKKSTFKHMKDDIQVSGVDQFGHVNVGFGEDTYWRVHFVELGTVNQKANPFIERAIDASREEYESKISSVIRSELGL
ncbi:HK97-gp10 family putative phage morphogenesis protein [Ligilactobacillus salivarius]|uniref:HK97-gp10 family putative phage morphogenesis protein n=1 Tax=Ligilactobacillus salivarius TaxID=1624 RepID=UPI0009D98B2E|nr:HK97-gp10 family putative phage morphogenesis protein [Ligilactobacillus salivarius]OQR15233.1 head-tail adaptor protein [Ligilactobacillus salivarius]